MIMTDKELLNAIYEKETLYFSELYNVLVFDFYIENNE